MPSIFLSPHFDDVALSCGGLIWEKTRKGEPASIWTICGGEVPDGPLSDFAEKLHARWETGTNAVQVRRQEDIASCNRLNAAYLHLPVPDCIYRFSQAGPLHTPGGSPAEEALSPLVSDPTSARRHLYSEESYLGPIHPEDKSLIQQLADHLRTLIPENSLVFSPLALGGHVDHRLTRGVAEKLDRPLLFYADYPYCLRTAAEFELLRAGGWSALCPDLTAEGMKAWKESIAAHASQISTFWPDLESMVAAVESYWEVHHRAILWRRPEHSNQLYQTGFASDC